MRVWMGGQSDCSAVVLLGSTHINIQLDMVTSRTKNYPLLHVVDESGLLDVSCQETC